MFRPDLTLSFTKGRERELGAYKICPAFKISSRTICPVIGVLLLSTAWAIAIMFVSSTLLRRCRLGIYLYIRRPVHSLEEIQWEISTQAKLESQNATIPPILVPQKRLHRAVALICSDVPGNLCGARHFSIPTHPINHLIRNPSLFLLMYTHPLPPPTPHSRQTHNAPNAIHLKPLIHHRPPLLKYPLIISKHPPRFPKADLLSPPSLQPSHIPHPTSHPSPLHPYPHQRPLIPSS